MELIVVLSILAGFLWAFSNVIDRYVVNVDPKNGCYGILFVSMVSVIPTFPILLLIFEVSIPNNIITLLIYMLVGVLYFFSIYFYLEALKRAEATSVAVLLRLTSVFILVGEILFLSAAFKYVEMIGMGLLLLSSLLISLKSFRDLEINKSFSLMLVSGLLLSLRGLLADYAVGGNPIELYTWSLIGISISCIGLFIFPRTRKEVEYIIKNRTETRPSYMMLSKNLSGLAILSYILALDMGSVSIVSFLTSLQTIFVLIIVVFLNIILGKAKEELDRDYSLENTVRTIVAVLIAVTGVVLISFS